MRQTDWVRFLQCSHVTAKLNSSPPFLSYSQLLAASSWPESARRHQQIRVYGQEGDQQTAQTEREEERVDACVNEA